VGSTVLSNAIPRILSPEGSFDGQIIEINRVVFLVDKDYADPLPWGRERVKINGHLIEKVTITREYLKIKRAAAKLIEAEQTGTGDIEGLREQLNFYYDQFVKEYGTFTGNNALKFLKEDIDHPVVFGLEKVKKKFHEENGRVKELLIPSKSDIFSNRVLYPVSLPTKADSLEEAMNMSLAWYGKINIEFIAGLIGESEEAATEQLLRARLMFKNNATRTFDDRNKYLSGFVKDKLMVAEAAAERDPSYRSNVEELTLITPAKIPASLVLFRLGSTWIPERFIAEWITRLLKFKVTVIYSHRTGNWIVEANDKIACNSPENITRYQAGGFSALNLIDKTLNLQQAVAKDREWNSEMEKYIEVTNPERTQAAQIRQMELSNMFVEWIRENQAYSKELEEIYNHKFNNLVERKFDIPYFDHYPGANKNIKLRDHQKRAASRAIQDSGLLAHGVGTGKTFTKITTAMEMRRLGKANKPLFAVQNATRGQYVEAFKNLYPAARIYVPQSEMEPANRKTLFERIKKGNWDAIIIPHSFLNMMPNSVQKQKEYINNELKIIKDSIDELAKSNTKHPLIKEYQKKEKELLKILDSLIPAEIAENDMRGLCFEELGIDALFIDEAHAFKRLGFKTKMANVKGIDTNASGRAVNLMVKVQHVQDTNQGRNVVLATGTPISNTMAEVWTFMRYTSPMELKILGIDTFDNFAATFGEIQPVLEYTSAGTFKVIERFSKFVNVPELVTMFRYKTDVVLNEDVREFEEENSLPKLKDGKFTQITIPQSIAVKNKITEFRGILKRYEEMDPSEKKYMRFIPLLVYARARQAAVDVRLVQPDAPDDPESKTNRVVEELMRIYKLTDSYKGTQLVFCDLYQSPDNTIPEMFSIDGVVPSIYYKKDRFYLYKDIKKKLIENGVHEKEIAIIHEFTTDSKRLNLFDKLQSGEVRVCFGSTETLGVGVNAQERLYAIHHIDAPARPMDFEQRNGRAIRQGNLHALWNKVIEIIIYGVEKTLDATAFQRLSIKQKFINQMMKGEIRERSIEDAADDSEMTFDELMANLSGSQYAYVYTKKMYDLKQLEMQRDNHDRTIYDLTAEIRSLEKYTIPKLQERMNEVNILEGMVNQCIKEEEGASVFKISIGDTHYTEKLGNVIEDYFKALSDQLIALLVKVDKPLVTGAFTVNDLFQIQLEVRRPNDPDNPDRPEIRYRFRLSEKAYYDFYKTVRSGTGFINSFRRVMEELLEEKVYVLGALNRNFEKIRIMQEDRTKPFNREPDIKKLKEEILDLEVKMQAEKLEE
jgi:N12 class adenine-specific DNA methylase